jgi:hypothetical protein
MFAGGCDPWTVRARPGACPWWGRGPLCICMSSAVRSSAALTSDLILKGVKGANPGDPSRPS